MTPSAPPQIQLPNQPAAPPPPVFGSQDPTTKKPQQKTMTPTFLGTGSTPSQSNQGFKTLLGQ